MDFWCEICSDWTPADESDQNQAWCGECGEPYQCGECGGDIAPDGTCQSDPTHGE